MSILPISASQSTHPVNACERVVGRDGFRRPWERCEVKHGDDCESWCDACLESYLDALQSGTDPMAGVNGSGLADTPFVRAELDARERAFATTEVDRQTWRDDDFRPTYEDRVEVGPIAEAEWEGLQSGLSGDPCCIPVNYSDEEKRAYARGYEDGAREYQDESLAAWVEEMERQAEAFADPFDNVNPEEIVRSLGVAMARRIGGAL